jgi:putative tryptophan/tyrosine transport system substrate-binding protein
MRRREFIAGLGSAVAWPVVARAQQGDRMRRVGVLWGGAEDNPINKPRVAAFGQGLARLGRIDYRFTSASQPMFQALAKELIALQPDVLLANTTPAAAALQREGSAIPIVFLQVSDPIGSGFVASLARPGGNLTGLLNIEASITGKWLAMLKEIAPPLARAALIANPKTTPYDYFLQAAEAAAMLLAIELVPNRVETAADIQRAIESFARLPNGGLVLPPDITSADHRDLFVALAGRHRLPAVYSNRIFVAAGGLMSYGVDGNNLYRQVASYVDRILRGDKPADLPVQTPVKYETFLNLKTAEALGLTIPETLLATADEVIQ